ncbi:MAG: hypothetical protein HY363_01700 [Candidatus Aenigmarchaeota archaeon]|nr:hypothetical protein [Candidatus Aenigmarchaeota archaeon]
MHAISIIAGFVIANIGLICGYFLTRCLPDEKSDVEKLFNIKIPFVAVSSAGVIASFYPTPISAGILFVFLLIVGSSIASSKARKLLLLWTCSMTAFLIPYVTRLML